MLGSGASGNAPAEHGSALQVQRKLRSRHRPSSHRQTKTPLSRGFCLQPIPTGISASSSRRTRRWTWCSSSCRAGIPSRRFHPSDAAKAQILKGLDMALTRSGVNAWGQESALNPSGSTPHALETGTELVAEDSASACRVPSDSVGFAIDCNWSREHGLSPLKLR